MSKGKKDKLILLEKLIQSSSEGEITTEQRNLFVNLVEETSPKSPKMRKKNINSSERQSRQKVKYVKTKSHEFEDQNHGKVQIPLPQNDRRSRSRSSNSRSDSASSFWSSGSRDRVKNRKTSSRSSSRSSRSSRSRSRSHSHSRSRSRSGSSSASYSTSRSRSRSSSYSRDKVRVRSKSPRTQKSGTKKPMAGSLTSIQSAPVQQYRTAKIIRDTASETGRNKRKKLNKRSEIKKSRSLDINPDIFIEERLKRKYKELHNLLSSQFSDSQAQMTQQQFQQMQNLRTQYVNVSHGLPPSGILVPRSLPASMRVKRGAPQGLTSMKSRSRDTLISDLGEDHTYVSVQRVLNTAAAREGKVVVDPHPSFIRKKKGKKKSDSNSKLNSTIDSTSDHTGSRTLSPRSRLNGPELHHLKDSDNPKMLKWLKEKDKEHRKKEREERKKRREEREKLVLEANEKFEKRLESHKHVEKWRAEKEKEYRKMMKRRKNEEKEMEKWMKPKMELNVPGRSMTVRPQSAPSEWKRKSESSSSKTKKGTEKTEKNQGSNKEALTVQDQLGTSSEHLKFDLNDTNKSQDQLPPTSKFMYKRPVAGKIKLNMRNRPVSAQPKLQTTNTEKSTNSQSARESHEGNTRLSYDDWVNTKRKQDQEKKKQDKIRQKEELAKSDPDMERIVPDVAKKRIHTIMNERKSIDTGIKRYDTAVNGSFGGGSFDGSKSPKTPTKTHSYKLDDNRPATAKDRTVESLKVAGKSYQRPGTAPSGGRKVPVPTRSPYSPVPANHPASLEQVMNSEDQSNPFKLPFPPEEGVPKHVAARQKKIFGEQNFQKNERPEPQGCDSSLALVPSSPAVEVNINSPEDIQYDNITAMETSKNIKDDEKKDYTTQEIVQDKLENKINEKQSEIEEKKDNINEKLNKNDNKEKVEENSEKKLNGEADSNKGKIPEEKNETVLENKSNESEENSETSQASLSEDLAGGNSDNSNTVSGNEQNGQDEVDSKKEEQKNEDDGTSLSQSIKHVSFCEEPEVFVDNEVGQEWSTDTGTPDEDNSRYTTKEDLSTLIDHCGKLLNDEYGDQNGDDKAFLTESLDDDF